MSVHHAHKFLNQTRSDRFLQARLEAIAARNLDDGIARLIAVARSAGYDFSADDFEQAIRELVILQRTAGEMGREELAFAAGILS